MPSHPYPSVRTHVPSTACDVNSINGQVKRYPPTCAEWRDLSNHTRISTIQSRTPEKRAKNHVTLTGKFSWNLVPPPTYLSFPLILRSWERSLKRFSPKWSVLNPQQKKKMKQEKRKVKVNQSNRNFAFCACPNYASEDFASGSEGRGVLRPVNGFVVSFSSL